MKNERIKKLQGKLKEAKADWVVIDLPLNLYYLTGLKLSAGELFVGKKGVHLFVDGRYIEAAKQHSPFPVSLITAEEKQKFFKKNKIKKLAFDSENSSYERYLNLKASSRKSKFSLMPLANPLKEIRLIKDADEQMRLRRSARHLWEAFEHTRKLIKVGITEEQLALEFKLFGLKQGAECVGFEPIIAFGANSAFPHYRSGKVKLKEGDLILMDLGLVVDQYHSDMTRVTHFGKIEPLLKKIYTVVRKAHAAALKLCRPGVALGELDLAARKEMRKEDLESYFVHTLGHGVGLEIHEFPRISATGKDRDFILQEGMAITIEPGLYIPGKGGVRWEDTIIITTKGYENLYPNKEVHEFS